MNIHIFNLRCYNMASDFVFSLDCIYFSSFFFSYSSHSVPFCISFTCTALVVKQSYTLKSVPPDISSTQLALYIVIIVYWIYFCCALHSHDYSVTTNLYLLIPSLPFRLLHLRQRSVCFLYLWISFCFVCSFILFSIFHI